MWCNSIIILTLFVFYLQMKISLVWTLKACSSLKIMNCKPHRVLIVFNLMAVVVN